MTMLRNQKIRLENVSNQRDSLVDSIRVLSDITRRDIKRIENIHCIDTYNYNVSDRWTLKKKN